MKEILCSISTRNRYYTTLPTAILCCINQTRKPSKIVIFDDNDRPIDMRYDDTFKSILMLMDLKGIQWEVVYAERKGQHFNHQLANKMGYKFVWRVDDDDFPDPNVLETLYSNMKDNVGAVGGSIICPSWQLDINNPQNASGNISEIYTKQNKQWFLIKEKEEVDHLHCSFLYRAGIVDYNLNLSRIAHREESLFTWELKQKGYKILIVPDAITYHMKTETGGIRDGVQAMYDHDDWVFHNLVFNLGKLIVLDSGIGDHIVFKSILPELKEKYDKISIACCYPEVFENCEEDLYSLADAEKVVDKLNHNIYKFMDENNWKDSLQNAYRKLYI